MERCDVVIIGGALWGCSTAYHLLMQAPCARVAILERDPTFEHAPSALSTAGVRILFSQEESIRMSKYGHEFYGDFAHLMALEENPLPLAFHRKGYLFTAGTAEQVVDMEENHRLQIALGCDVRLLDGEAVKRQWPSMVADDIACAAWSPGDGWIDPWGALTGLVRKVKALGATYRQAEVSGIERKGRRVSAVILASGERLEADFIVNTAGVWGPQVCAMVGMKVPVAPLPRQQFYFETDVELEPMPLVRDHFNSGFRPEGRGYLAGLGDSERLGQFFWDTRYDWFEERLWPGLAERVPAFERLKIKNAWACHYAQNTFDGVTILGPWAGEAENFLIALGDSGHGLQHAPAGGRALAELILKGRFETIDLSRLSYQRVLDNKPYPERGLRL